MVDGNMIDGRGGGGIKLFLQVAMILMLRINVDVGETTWEALDSEKLLI